MDDDWKENRRNKPQQKLYKPGSGPLRRTSYGLDNKMNSYDVTNGPRSGNQSHYGSKNSIYEEDVTSNNREHGGTRHKKPEQQLYVVRPADGKLEDDRHSNTSMRCDSSHQSYNRRNSNNKNDKHGYNNSGFPRGPHPRRDRSFVDSHKNVAHNDVNYNRNYRQVSEPRSMSPTHHVQEVNSVDRNRDTRSMETSAGRHNSGSGGKPPSGRRNSAGYPSDTPRPKYTLNLDNLPPRLRKKFLEQAGHHTFEHNDHANRDKYTNHTSQPNYNQGAYHNQKTNWSQTLPSRGRGRLRENEGFDRDKFINSYLKTCDAQSSRRSTPSSSYMNLYEPNSIENKHISQTQDTYHNNHQKEHYDVSKNGNSNTTYNNKDEDHSKNESDSEPVSCSSNLMDMTNLDWTEEVEKNMKFNDVCDSTASSPTRNMQSSSISQDTKSIETKSEPRESKRRAKRRDKRSSSRGQKNDKRNEQLRRDSGQQDVAPVPVTSNLKQRDRERRDSHRSNHSSNIGNSRDDLDRWRSLRSFSREQSTEGRIVSQCNSRDTSANRALSPRDNDGFRIPSAAAKNSTWTSTNQKKNGGGPWTGGGRNPSSERGRQSPAPSTGGEGGGGEGASTGGGGRKSRRRTGRRRGRNSDTTAPPAPHPAGATPAPVGVNWRDEILESKKHTLQDRLDRHQEVNRNRLNSTQSEKSESSTSHPGLLILPQSSVVHLNKERGREGSADTQKLLYDYNNPSKPIVVQTHSSKVDTRLDRATTEPRSRPSGGGGEAPDAGEAQRAARHRPLLQEVDRADAILQTHTLRGPVALAAHWSDVTETRKFLQGALQRLLMSDLKYCQADNVEHYFWKILYYNFIEVLRKSLSQASAEEKSQIVKLINTIIEEGNLYYENLVQTLEKTYKFNTGDYINDNHSLPPKGLGYVGLALISVQKLYVFLGDLARYKEQVNETNNYAKSKYFYTKAQQINPKNGRPYNQLAILAIYARRKLDAVFYYMRSLMSSNPFHSARESLISLFDENRKKYEAAERKRRAATESANTADDKTTRGPRGRGMRREVWVRPSGRRTTTLRQEAPPDALASMTPVELNKNFITSYLHVHGKLVTKIGMETCRDSAALMLRQFRALLHQQPLPTPAARLLQLTQLNMFAVETTLNSNKDVDAGERSAWLECAVSISLLMFGALLERCCALLPEPQNTQQHADALLLLPAIKVWSDWMLCHSSVWNPPPSFDSFDIGSDINPWDWLAKLMNILETLDDKTIVFESEMKEGYEAVRLPEDGVLAGFTPLMYMEPAAAIVRDARAPHLAEHALRTRKLLFFGTEYLVGVEPPVLRLEYPSDAPPRYVSAVQRGQTANLPLQDLSEDSEEELEDEEVKEPAPSEMNWAADTLDGAEGADEATRRLLRRKGQLESRRANMERRRQRMQELLRGGWVSVEVEVRPRWLVPDTNCFIDHLPLLRRVVAAAGQPYLLAVPIVVVTELEGLRRCARVGPSAAAALAWMGAGGASAGGAGGAAPPGVRFATSRGSLLASRVFTAERESVRATNDDKVLATALNLHANIANEPELKATVTATSRGLLLASRVFNAESPAYGLLPRAGRYWPHESSTPNHRRTVCYLARVATGLASLQRRITGVRFATSRGSLLASRVFNAESPAYGLLPRAGRYWPRESSTPNHRRTVCYLARVATGLASLQRRITGVRFATSRGSLLASRVFNAESPAYGLLPRAGRYWPRESSTPNHRRTVCYLARVATGLASLQRRITGVRFATSRGSLLASRLFTAERESVRATNDDKVLATALNLHVNISNEPDVGASETGGEGGPCVRRVREVVLLTDDRNLRVKALAAELPARDLPSFVDWAALETETSTPAPGDSSKPDALH